MSRILVAGDVMIDRYIVGQVERISPEAPVPVVKVSEEYSTLGGAANVSHNLSGLGMQNDLFGAIADDDYGRQLSTMVDELGIGNKLIMSLNTTITKTRVISRGQQMLRIDREEGSSFQVPHPRNLEDYSAVLISDYGKGFCNPAFCSHIIEAGKAADIPVFIDPKGKDWDKYRGAFVVKPNIKEMEDVLGQTLSNQDDVIGESGELIRKKYAIDHLIITRGEKGMTLCSDQGIHHFPVSKVDVYDVSGAGDTAIAVLVREWIFKKDLHHAIVMANKASSFVVTRPQTYAILWEEYQKL